ncbi:MAG: type II toxin-antitoxin system PemK/MazF family toxin [Deltaproteobacteria bacterium]|nr:type II toxin-antitoxin system PemK/MazF family toxin [Deltaproteobacteria bacterium]
MIQPGEIYMADFGLAGPHPVIVVSREELNRGRYALVVVCTSARFAVRRKLSNCVAQCENILSLDQSQIDLVVGPIGRLDEESLRQVIKAIGYVIKSNCTPL